MNRNLWPVQCASRSRTYSSNVIDYNSKAIKNLGYAVPLLAALSFGSCKDNPVGPVTPTAPNAPSSLTGTPTGETSGNLAWQDNSNNETNFYIWRASNGQFVKFDSVGANVTQYTDSRIERGSTKQYEVSAIDKTTGLESEKSNAATISPAVIPPGKPSMTVAAKSWREMDLNWNANTDANLTGYDVLRGTTKAGVQKIITLPANVTSYADTGLDQSTDYFYALVAKDLLAQTSSDTLRGTTKDVLINVNGNFHDIVTGQPIAGKKVRLIYNTKGDSLEVTTDGAGNYAFSGVKLVKGRQQDFAVRALGEQDFYNFLEKFFQTYPNFADVRLDPFSFQQGTIQEDPISPQYNYAKDKLEYLKYSHVTTFDKFPDVLCVHRWLNPIKDIYYSGRMSDSSKAVADRGINLLETKLGKKLYNKVSSEPQTGVVVQFGDFGLGNSISLWSHDNDGNLLYPLKATISLPTDSSGNPLFSETSFTHEGLYVENTSLNSSPFPSHNRFGYPFGPANVSAVPTNTEIDELQILYKLPLTKDRKYLLYK